MQMQTSAQQMSRYAEVGVKTLNRGRLLLSLYEGAINFTRSAIKSTEKGDVVQKLHYIRKSRDIITEFLRSLDKKQGGEIALNLEQLYLFMLGQISEALATDNVKPLEVVVNLLETLKEGWEVAVSQWEKNEFAA